MQCFTCKTGVISILPLATHLDGQRHKKKTRTLPDDEVRFICRLCHNAPFTGDREKQLEELMNRVCYGAPCTGDKQWLCEHIDSHAHPEKVVEGLMSLWGWPSSFLYIAPEEIKRQIELAKERTSGHLRRLCGSSTATNSRSTAMRNRTTLTRNKNTEPHGVFCFYVSI